MKFEIGGYEKCSTHQLGNDLTTSFGSGVEVLWLSPTDTEGESGIAALHLTAPSGL